MITKIKSLSKRTLSVLLVLLMVISTVTVGIITTTAAYTDEDEAVGDSAGWKIVIDSNWYDLNGTNNYEKELTQGNHTLQFVNYNNGKNTYYASDTTFSETKTNYNISTTNSDTKITVSASVSGTYKFKRNTEPANGSISISVTFPSSGSSTDWWVIGHQFDTEWNTDGKSCKMTLDSSTGYYYYEKNFTASSNYYRIHDGSDEYQPGDQNEITLGTKYTLSSGNSRSVNIPNTLTGTHRVWWDATNKQTWVTAASKTVTYGYATGSNDTMGTISVTKKSGGSDVSIGASPATVANGEAVTFTATPVFGYHFVGWYTDDAGTTLNTTINASENDGSDIGVISTYPAISVTSNITAYAKFAPNTSDGYYLSGRFATATNDANIHSNTTGKSVLDKSERLLDL